MSLGVSAVECECGFSTHLTMPLDMRPRRTAVRTLGCEVGSQAVGDLAGCTIERPPNTYKGPSAQRDSSELFSAVADNLRPGARLLDLGCGPRDQAGPAAHYGLQYVGIDHGSAAADLLADAHALPFRRQTFDAVLAYAVLEHLYNPFLALAEVARVLVPGGLFFGAVSQGEPFHDSFFHHTAPGLLTLFRASRLEPQRLWYSYDTLHALATMGRYAKPIRWLIEVVYRLHEGLPFLAPRKHFGWTRREREIDELHRAASICFVARRVGPGASSPESLQRDGSWA